MSQSCFKQCSLKYYLPFVTDHYPVCRDCGSPLNGHVLNDDDAMGYWKREYEKGWELSISFNIHNQLFRSICYGATSNAA